MNIQPRPTRPVTFEMTDEEIEAIQKLAASSEQSETWVMRQALRWYQQVRRRIADGEQVSFSGDADRARMFRGEAPLDPTTAIL